MIHPLACSFVSSALFPVTLGDSAVEAMGPPGGEVRKLVEGSESRAEKDGVPGPAVAPGRGERVLEIVVDGGGHLACHLRSEGRRRPAEQVGRAHARAQFPSRLGEATVLALAAADPVDPAGQTGEGAQRALDLGRHAVVEDLDAGDRGRELQARDLQTPLRPSRNADRLT